MVVQSRAQQLLALLLPARACAKALLRPAASGLTPEGLEDFEWVEEGEEEEAQEDDPIVDLEAPEAPGEEADALADVEGILHAKKPSSDQDLLNALATAACPEVPEA